MRSTKSLASVLLGLCLAMVSRPASAAITFDGERARRALEAYVAHLERDPEKFASDLATIHQLERSEVEYRVCVGGDFRENVDGELTTDGQRVFVAISNGEGANGRGAEPFTRFSERACLAHELEHARQFDAGEFAFERDPATGRWHAERPSFDISDERRAWEAQLRVAGRQDFWRRYVGAIQREPSLLAIFATARTDAERESVLARHGYADLWRVPNCVWAPSLGGLPAGALVGPDRMPNVFGRIGRAGAVSLRLPPSE